MNFFLLYTLTLLELASIHGICTLLYTRFPHCARYIEKRPRLTVQMMCVCLSNVVCIAFPVVYGVAHYVERHVYHPRDIAAVRGSDYIRVLALCALSLEVWFYATHRLFHHPLLYRHVHKMHHRYRFPTPMCALYAHPVEFLLGNLGGIVCVPLLCPSSWVRGVMSPELFVAWVNVCFIGSLLSHSGISLLGASSHDIHHQQFSVHYGVFQLCDVLFG